MTKTAWRIAVVGAGPVGLALALHASRLLPHARISLFDARGPDVDVSADPRTLALALGSVQFLQQLGAWPAAAAEPILHVHVSQAPVLLSRSLAAIPTRTLPCSLNCKPSGYPLRHSKST